MLITSLKTIFLLIMSKILTHVFYSKFTPNDINSIYTSVIVFVFNPNFFNKNRCPSSCALFKATRYVYLYH